MSIRIEAQFTAYGADKAGAEFYIQTDSGTPTALIADVLGDKTLLLRSKPDIQELKSFLKFIGYHSVTMSVSDAKVLFSEYPAVTQYPLMKLVSALKTGSDTGIRLLEPGANAALYRQVYALGGFSSPFSDWYADMAVRVSKGTAFGALLLCGENLKSMALASYVCPRGFFISAVATKEGHREKGSASSCVKALCGTLPGEAYLWCKNELTAFYRRLGFSNDGTIAVVLGKREV